MYEQEIGFRNDDEEKSTVDKTRDEIVSDILSEYYPIVRSRGVLIEASSEIGKHDVVAIIDKTIRRLQESGFLENGHASDSRTEDDSSDTKESR